jgi:hypothetical protein
MKKKTFEKKLVINKKTIAHLNSDEMRIPRGGRKRTDIDKTCNPDDSCSCT